MFRVPQLHMMNEALEVKFLPKSGNHLFKLQWAPNMASALKKLHHFALNSWIGEN